MLAAGATEPDKQVCAVCDRLGLTLTLPIKAAERHLSKHEKDYEGPCRPNGDD